MSREDAIEFLHSMGTTDHTVLATAVPLHFPYDELYKFLEQGKSQSAVSLIMAHSDVMLKAGLFKSLAVQITDLDWSKLDPNCVVAVVLMARVEKQHMKEYWDFILQSAYNRLRQVVPDRADKLLERIK